MRIHRLLLQNFRGVRRRELVFPAAGVIVVEGRNEAGKSSLVEALDLLLEEKDSAAKAAVRAVQPVGRDVPTVVEAELSLGPYRFTYRKQFHRETATELTLSAPVHEQLTGGPAHDRVRSILAESLDERLFKALRLLQATPLARTGMTESVALTTALDRAAGLAADSGDGGSLLAAARAERDRFLTMAGRARGPLREADARLARATVAADRAEAELAEIDADADRHTALAAERDQIDVRRGALTAELADARERLVALTTLAAAAERARTAEVDAAGDAARAQARNRARQAAVDEHEGRIRAGIAVRQQRDAAVVTSQSAQQRLVELGTAAGDAAAAGEVARQRADRARAACDLAVDVAELARLDRSAAELAAATAEETAAAALARAAPLDARRLRAIEDAAAELALHTARRRDAAPTVRLAMEAGVGATIDGVPAVDGGESIVTAPVTVATTGLTVIITPGADAATLTAAVDRADRSLRDELASAGVTDLGQARSAHERHRTAADQLARARQRLAAASAAVRGRDLDAGRDRLRGRIAAAGVPAAVTAGVPAAVTAGVPQQDDEDGPDRPDADDRVAAARDLVRLATREAEAAHRLSVDAASALTEQQRVSHELQVTVAGCAARLSAADAEEQLAAKRLQAERVTAGDDQLAAAVRVATGRASAAAVVAADLAAKLPDGSCETARAEVDRLETQAGKLATDHDAVGAELSRLQGRLDAVGSQGRQDVADAARSELVAADRDRARLRRRADAAETLVQALDAQRAQARSNYVAPFRAELLRLGRVVFGADLDVTVGADLSLISRTLSGQTVAFEHLSAGAREQLAVVIRLACAGLVSASDAVPVFLDDALGYSDPDRLARMADVFGLAGISGQVILLTCDPQRLAALPGAQVLRLTDGDAPGTLTAASETVSPSPTAPVRTARSAGSDGPARRAARPVPMEPAELPPGLFDAPTQQHPRPHRGRPGPPGTERHRPLVRPPAAPR